MKLSRSRLCRELIDAATAFHSRALWREYTNDECFALLLPEEEHPMLGSVMGQGGEEFGLMLFRGPEARDNALEMLTEYPDERDMADSTPMLGFSMTRYAKVPPFGRSLLRTAGRVCRRETMVPLFIAKHAGRQPRGPTPDELQKCLYALTGLLKAHDEGTLRPTPLRAGAETLTLRISGDVLNPDV